MCRTHFLVEPDDGHVLWCRGDTSEVGRKRISDKGYAYLEGGGETVNPHRGVVPLVGNQAPYFLSNVSRAEIANLPVSIDVSGGVHLDVLTLFAWHPTDANRVPLVVREARHAPELVDAVAFRAGALVMAGLHELVLSFPNGSNGGEH